MKTALILLLAISSTSTDDIAVQEITNSNNLFSSSIYKAVYKTTNKNFILSPLSAEVGLSFLQSGCRGKSSEEIRRVLHLSTRDRETQSGFRTLLSNLTGNGFYSLHIINKMYVKKTFTIRPKFKKNGKQNFRADTQLMGFNKRVKAANAMNKWVEKNTRSRVRNIIAPSALNSSTRVVLLDAFYFRANWSNPFSQTLTRKSSFYTNLYDNVSVDMMFQEATINFFENSELDAKFMELPFKGGEASLIIVVPNSRDGLASLENRIDKVLEPQKFIKQTLFWGLPKFKIETRVHLKNILEFMGVNNIFNKNQADLSLIAGKKGGLFVSEILQKVYVNVAEGGVEVAGSVDNGKKI